MSDKQVKTINDIQRVLHSIDLLKLEKTEKKEAYSFAEQTLRRFQYRDCTKPEKSLVIQYIIAMTGYSRAQVKRFIAQYKTTGYVQVTEYERNKFPRTYTEEDVRLLAETDEYHDCPNGNALRTICEQEYKKYHKQEYRRLAGISVSHIYNLRQTKFYRRIATSYNPTQPVINIEIGSREKPYPNGVPGYVRIDTVHQGNKGRERGLYHLNIVDEVTQFEFLVSVPQISQKYMEPVLFDALQCFPFQIVNFHSDNGGEFINHTIAELLNRLHIKHTKSRARKTNDNALVESKNGSIIRKHIGYQFMGQDYAQQVNDYYQRYYNFYLNFYRPSGFATEVQDKRGKIKKVYKLEDYKTPYQAFLAIDNYQQYANPYFDSAQLEETVQQYNPTEFAKIMKKARSNLLRNIELPNLHIFDIGRFVKARSKPNSSVSSLD